MQGGGDGPLFVDSDPMHFELMLEYLWGTEVPPVRDVSELQWLEAAGKQFRLLALSALCKDGYKRSARWT